MEKAVDGTLTSKQCIHVEFPNHTQHAKRKPCGAPLLQRIAGANRTLLRPFKVYAYYPIKATLTRLFNRPGFLSLCEKWRQRRAGDEIMGDIYDGQIWNEFQHQDGRNFLAAPNSLATALNLDWFQPFTHVRYSVGALYLVILNLPREERYKIENIILVAIIPGPKEPKKTVNSFLAPLI